MLVLVLRERLRSWIVDAIRGGGVLVLLEVAAAAFQRSRCQQRSSDGVALAALRCPRAALLNSRGFVVIVVD